MAQTADRQAGRPAWSGRLGVRLGALSRERIIDFTSLASVTLLAFALFAWRLNENAWGNTYYAAAVRSMSRSWHNFFFASFDPGGFISVDKPPVFLWVGAVSVRVFGYNSWALLLPSALAGTATVALTWYITRRLTGAWPATIAALVLAFTPITVAVDRLNLPEPFLILVLLGAAGATLRSLGSPRWWAWTIAAGVLVGIAFNIKMLAGWIPGPALALALVIGDGDTLRLNVRRIAARLAILAAATFLVSASWMVVVDGWPAGSRPYVGGSTDNSVSNLAFDYNGLGRVEGQGGRPGGTNRPPFNNNGNNRNLPNGGFPNRGGFGGQPPVRPAGPVGGGNGAGGIIAGTPGLGRMFDDANGQQIAWFLPFALLGSIISLWRWRTSRVLRAAVVLFAGWVLLFGLVFSYAEGTYHSYYTSAMAPGIAILVGLTVAAAADLVRRDVRWLAALAAPLLATAWVQLTIAGRFPGFRDQLEPLAIAGVIGGAALAIGAVTWRRVPLQAALGIVVGGLLVLPASWATYEATHPSMNTTLPQAGPREGSAGRSFGSAAFDEGSDSLAGWLAAHTQPGTAWDLAVPSAQNASALMAGHDLSIMAIGGFLGSDPTITVSQFADLVAAGKVRYVLVSGGGFRGPAGGFPNRGPQGQFPGGAVGLAPQSSANAKGAGAIESAARSACTQVTTGDVPAQYRGAIYDCAAKADALRQLG